MHNIKSSIRSYRYLEEIGRIRLSENFLLRDFLHSEIAAAFGLTNAPSDLDLAIEVGSLLCEELLEPIQRRFGRISIRSGYRSAEVNQIGHRLRLNCASNRKNAAGHIWDLRDCLGRKGATACIVIPAYFAQHQQEGDWRVLADWIEEHLNYSSLCFFPKLWACNVQWRDAPVRTIKSYAHPRGQLQRQREFSFNDVNIC